MTKRFLKSQVFVLLLVIVGIALAGIDSSLPIIVGYLISFLFVFVSIVVIDRGWGFDDRNFLNAFWFSMAIRFLFIIIALIIVYGVTKIDEIYFTVSFIISYLCHSITEMIFINKILKKGSTKP